MTRSRMLMIVLIAAAVCVVSAGVGAADASGGVDYLSLYVGVGA